MAGPYFWVGGSGSWSDATNHWATSSGGAPNVANVPTSADNVNFDSASNTTAYTVTVDTTANCKDMTWALPSVSGVPTFAGSVALNIAGSLTKVATMVWTHNGALTFSATTTGKTITSAGVGYAQTVQFTGAGGGWTLLDSFTNAAANSFTVSNGTLVTGAFTHSFGFFTSTSGTRTLTLDNSTINITGTSGTPINLASTSLTFSNTNTTWNVNGGAAGVTLTLTLSNLAYNTFNITGAGLWNMNCNGSFKTFSYTSTTNKTDALQLVANPTIAASGSLTLAGNSTVNRAFVRGQVLGTQQTWTVPNTATVTLTNVDFQDIASAGTFGTWTGTSLGDALGNSGITFDPSVTLTWDTSKTGAQNWSGSNWLGTTNRVPLPQDDVILPAIGSATTITQDMPRQGRNIDETNFNRAVTSGSVTTFNFGNLTWGASSTFSAVATHTLAGRGAQTFTTNGKTTSSSITISAFGGTYTLQDALTSTSTFNHTAGTLADGGNNLSGLSYGSSGAIARAVSGSGTWSFSATTGSIWNAAGSVFTTTAFTGTIKFTGNISTTATFAGNGLTYPNFWWSNTAATGTLIITGANTFNDVKWNRTTPRTIQFPAGPNTITTWTDENLGTAILTLTGGGSSAKLTKASGTVSTDYLNVTNIDAPTVPDPSLWYAGVHSVNNSGTRFIFTAPPTGTEGQTVLSDGRSGASFSRKRFEELLAAQRAQEEAERRAAELKNSKQKAALLKAASVAQLAIDAIRASEEVAEAREYTELTRMTAMLEAATGAKKVAAIISDANAAQDHAMAILAEMEDEDEAVMLLLH